MKKKTNARPLQQVVRANKRGGSGLPGAAQRARSRQRGATLREKIEDTKRLLRIIVAKQKALQEISYGAKIVLRELRAELKASRRPFGANVVLSDGGREAQPKE